MNSRARSAPAKPRPGAAAELGRCAYRFPTASVKMASARLGGERTGFQILADDVLNGWLRHRTGLGRSPSNTRENATIPGRLRNLPLTSSIYHPHRKVQRPKVSTFEYHRPWHNPIAR